MTLGCYIVDDENHAIKILSKYIEKTPWLTLIGSDTNPLETWTKIDTKVIEPDVIFLDVDMPQLSGMELAELIRFRTEIVFTTAHPDYAIQAFDTDALDYLLKPVTYERFLRSISKARERCISKGKEKSVVEEADEFFIKSELKGKMVKIRFSDIVYIESKANYLQINLAKEFYLVYLTMKELEEKLAGRPFMRVHKSFIINLRRLTALEGNMVILENNLRVDVGATYKENLMAMISPKLISSKRL